MGIDEPYEKEISYGFYIINGRIDSNRGYILMKFDNLKKFLKYAKKNKYKAGIIEFLDSSLHKQLFDYLEHSTIPEELCWLASLYMRGEACEQNPKKAFAASYESYAKGYKKAFYLLGICYYYGYGTEKNLEEAIKYLKIAAEFGIGASLDVLVNLPEQEAKKYLNSESLFDIALKCAKSGSKYAMNYVGYCYDNGIAVKKDISKAFYWFKKAVKKENPMAYYNYALLCEKNKLGSPKEIVKYYTKAVENKVDYAYYALGHLYAYGKYVLVNLDKSFELFNLAIENGDAQGYLGIADLCIRETKYKNYSKALDCYLKYLEVKSNPKIENTVGEYYLKGIGTKKDIDKAIIYFKKALDHGYLPASVDLANIYKQKGKYKNDALKFKYCKIASDNNISKDTIFEVAKCYEFGIGVKKSYPLALKYYRMGFSKKLYYCAAEIGRIFYYNHGDTKDFDSVFDDLHTGAIANDAPCCFEYGRWIYYGFHTKQDQIKAFKYLSFASQKGVPASYGHIGWYYANGKCVPKDLKKAIEYYNKGWDNGYSDCMLNLGLLYYNETSIKNNFEKALDCFKKAAEKKVPDAVYFLGRMYKEGKGVPKNEKLASEYFVVAKNLGYKENR